MKNNLLLITGLLTSVFQLSAQSYDPLNRPNTYRNSDNPYYWKNRIPYPGYWQQDTYYEITAELNDSTDIIDGNLRLTYWNNSPDELSFVYFHLYQNAFQPGSYLDNLQLNSGIRAKYGKYETSGLGTLVEKITVEGNELKKESENTILKVMLDKPLKSGESVVFEIKFKTYFDNGETRRRMKKFISSGTNHYDGVHWYPRICVYDRKAGWNTDQHLGHEFYGDFGAYDVELTLPNNYVVEATGNLVNRSEVLPDDLRQKLDLKNFVNKSWGEKSSVVIPKDGTKKTWKYHAENVHDFAFTADPTYRIGESEWNGIKCIALVQEPHASGWKNAAQYAANIIQVFSEDFGMYAYPKMIVADARDGMEYPMLTLDGGSDPGYRDLFAHEIGHNWFFGMVGNNETYCASLDEGFTQFLTVWFMDKAEGIYGPADSIKNQFVYNNTVLPTTRDQRAYLPYLRDAIRDQDEQLNTHSDQFGGVFHGGGYRNVYYKTATMLYNLQYVLGDEVFRQAMSHYFNQWKMCHPYFEDFRNSISRFTKTDLNWFFDQWLETTKKIDYGIKSVKPGLLPDEYIITFERKGRMQMPVDFRIYSPDESVHDYHIPNGWFVKNTPAKVLPRWIGWDDLKPVYQAKVIVPGGIANIVIDTTRRLADVNMMNNSWKFPVTFNLDAKIANPPQWTKYELYGRPDLWYNFYDGIKAGVHLNGNYMQYHHIFSATAWINTGMGQGSFVDSVNNNEFNSISFSLNYRTSLEKISKHTFINLSLKRIDGLNSAIAGFDKTPDKFKDNKIYFYFKSMFRPDSSDLNYLLYPNEWSMAQDPDRIKFNNTVTAGWEHSYNYNKGTGVIDLRGRTAAFSDFNYSYLSLQVINNTELGKCDLRTRTYLQYGKGKDFAKETQLYLAGANPEELTENKFTRASGLFTRKWVGDYGVTTDHFHAGGGLNLRGYAGYLVTQVDKEGEVRTVYRGTSGGAVNAELEIDRLFNIAPAFTRNWLHFDAYLFGDMGMINYNQPGEKTSFSDLRADAGIGGTITIKKWFFLQTAEPLTIRVDLPLFLNRTPFVDGDEYIKYRWVVGINRAF